ncbi:MAG: GNAT family N-acetyltransferase [Gammaproteobacteria bacterium]|nr:GNAT family N-acetyltransferase [Gammaproteobacteria bacterium]NCV88231.1 GNAT family N-acetyltransferase [Oxalobacteraceae bacterium]NBP08739.1 GNAT family N-acetyltransferase [Gammaproteobacteria bacterium]NBR18460.1 GNAT family N-acetyltransferase [Gammaproteobacteria bacterium]NCW22141.1 GNAT family N-acetyltransferase [Gammaproteobacteria bacterium]
MLKLRPARHDDAATLLELIRELADYEKLLDQVDATGPALEQALFGPTPRVFSDVAEWSERGETRVAGFALWFYNFSTFRGRHGIYLEDLFVRPEFRGRGIGKALLANLAKRCVDEQLTRLEWAVLDWNTPAREFYESLGAQALTEWVPHRVTGAALPTLAYPETRAEQAPPRR